MENKELEEKMVNLYLNRYGPDGHGHRDAGATPVGDGNGSGSGSETWELVWRMSYDCIRLLKELYVVLFFPVGFYPQWGFTYRFLMRQPIL
jgi:hypothetical protein